MIVMYYPGSQPPLKKCWFLLDDGKPLVLKTYIKKVVHEPTYKAWWLDFQGICMYILYIYR